LPVITREILMMAEWHRRLACAGSGGSLGRRWIANPTLDIWGQVQAGYSRKMRLGGGLKCNKHDLSLPPSNREQIKSYLEDGRLKCWLKVRCRYDNHREYLLFLSKGLISSRKQNRKPIAFLSAGSRLENACRPHPIEVYIFERRIPPQVAGTGDPSIWGVSPIGVG
jgi:hypothetical protein